MLQQGRRDIDGEKREQRHETAENRQIAESIGGKTTGDGIGEFAARRLRRSPREERAAIKSKVAAVCRKYVTTPAAAQPKRKPPRMVSSAVPGTRRAVRTT